MLPLRNDKSARQRNDTPRTCVHVGIERNEGFWKPFSHDRLFARFAQLQSASWGSQAGRPSPTNWDESTLDSGECGGETNVGNKQLGAGASDYASLETWWTGCADGVHHILRQARKPAIKSISASS